MTRCSLPPQSPRTNGDLLDAFVTTRGAWGACAAKVDMIVDCQAKAQARIDAEAGQGSHD